MKLIKEEQVIKRIFPTKKKEEFSNLGQPARPFIPEISMINQIGEHDHNTNYRNDYHSHGLSLCASKAFTIAQNRSTTATPIIA